MALLALPVLLVAHRQVFLYDSQGKLQRKILRTLGSPEFRRVQVEMHYLDVYLTGQVPDIASRTRARLLVDGVLGARCRPEDNRIRVTPRLEGDLQGQQLTLHGWLHDSNDLQQALNWISVFRPGLQIDSDGVQFAHFVVEEQAPAEGKPPLAAQPLLPVLQTTASLEVRRSSQGLDLQGYLPTAALADDIVEELQASQREVKIKADQIEAGPFVKSTPFARAATLPSFLRLFFASPGSVRFTATAHQIELEGNATPSLQREWQPVLQILGNQTTVHDRVKLYPSPYLFPEYNRISELSFEEQQDLEHVFTANPIVFEPGSAVIPVQEWPKLDMVAQALNRTSPTLRLVIYQNATANASNRRLALLRLQAIQHALLDRHVLSATIETSVFDTLPEQPTNTDQAEFLIR